MSSSDLAISVRGLSKQYVIAHEEKHTTLAEKWMTRLRSPLHRPKKETFEALKDVSFDVRRGEVVGIIGRNGAGKSTLLKILSRITEPTKGEIKLYGRVASLLEVGTGFHPELTGRENIYLNGAILGMRRAEIARKFDEIVAFAEVEKFLDTPVKRYSSGMYVRLAFAVAAHLEPEILIVDEVLAVGDAEFQKKCLGKMKEVSQGGGRTVLFVSHNMAAVQNLCSAAVLLAEGAVAMQGETAEVVSAYTSSVSRCEAGGVANIAACRVSSSPTEGRAVTCGSDFYIEGTLDLGQVLRGVEIGIGINTPLGERVVTLHTRYQLRGRLPAGRGFSFSCFWPKHFLNAGTYVVELAVVKGEQLVVHVPRAAGFTVEPADAFGTGRLPDKRYQGHVLALASWSVEPLPSVDHNPERPSN